MLALFIALTGTTYAASTALIGKNTVASPQVVNGSLQTKDLSAKARTALKGNRGLRGPQGAAGAQGAKGATGAQGVQGVQGTAGTAVAYARIIGNGTVDATLSKGIVQANVSHPATGFYCISGLAFTPHNAVASAQFVALTASTFVNAGSGYGSCPGTSQVSIAMYGDGGASADAPADGPFMIAIN
jgi:hypothetical protein